MKYYGNRGLRFFTALCLAHFVFISSSMFALASPERNFSAGEISVFGRGDNGEQPLVTVNGEPTASGRTFISTSLVETSQTSSADINLGNLGRVSLSPNSILSLSFTETSISGKLSAGKVRVISAAGVSVNIETPDDTVINDKDLRGDFTIDLQSGNAVAVVEAGLLHFSDGRPVAQTQTNSSGNNGVLFPVAILIGLVAAAVILTSIDDDDEIVPVSPTR